MLAPLASKACGPEFGKQVRGALAVKYIGNVLDQDGNGVGKTTVIVL